MAWAVPQNLQIQLSSPALTGGSAWQRQGGGYLGGTLGKVVSGKFSRRKQLSASQCQLQPATDSSGRHSCLVLAWGSSPGRSFTDQAQPRLCQASQGSHGVSVPIPQGRPPPPPTPGHPSLLFISSFSATKMSLARTVTSGPEPHSPEEPAKLQTPPVRGTWRASSEGAASTHREDTRPGLGTLRRAFSRTSQRPSGQVPEEDLGLFQRGSHFLFRSLRRAKDNGSTADQSHATEVPGVTHGPEVPSRVMDGRSRQSSAGVGRKELEPEAGESFTNSTEHGGKEARGEQLGGGFLTGCPPQPPRHRPARLCFTFSQHFNQGSVHWAAQTGESAKRGSERLSDLPPVSQPGSGEMGFEPRPVRLQNPHLSTAFHSLAPGQTRGTDKALALSGARVPEGAGQP